MRTLTAADVDSFASFCELQATFDALVQKKDGRELIRLIPDKTDEERYIVEVDNLLKLERDTADKLRAYYGMFGLDPASRSKIHVPKAPDEPVSKWAGQLK